jgi:predicted RecA/RadA family phage recombinase
MKATYYQKGETLDYTPAENTEAGQVVSLKTRIGVAAEDIPAGQLGHLHVVGVYSMAKADGEAIDMGAAVYYDATAEAITATEDSNTPAGYAAASAATTDATVLVQLLG